MSNLLAFVRFDRDRNRPLSRDEYNRWKAVGWFYLVLWLGIGLWVNFLPITPLLVRIPLNAILLITTPALTDLLESYDGYLRRRSNIRSRGKRRKHPNHTDVAPRS